MLQLEKPEDFVIATGHMHSVREFVEKSFAFIGKEIVWEGQGNISLIIQGLLKIWTEHSTLILPISIPFEVAQQKFQHFYNLGRN